MEYSERNILGKDREFFYEKDLLQCIGRTWKMVFGVFENIKNSIVLRACIL